MPVANQRKILVKRYSDTARTDFFKISNKNLQMAMCNLKGNAFKLFCYLADNAQGYELDLYPIDFQRVGNVSYDTYRRSFEELLEKGYLIPHKEKKNVFLFREVSQREDLINPDDTKDKIASLCEEEFEQEESTNFA